MSKRTDSKISGIYTDTKEIFRSNTECIVVPINAKCVISTDMHQKLVELAGEEVKRDLKNLFLNVRIKSGSCLFAKPHKLRKKGIKHILYGFDREYPKGFVTIHTVRELIRAAFEISIKNEIQSIALPGLGLNDALDIQAVAGATVQIAREYSYSLKIKITDTNESYIKYVDSLLKREKS